MMVLTESEGGGGSEGTGGEVLDEEVRQVTGGQVVEGFQGEEQHFEVDALFNEEPVEGPENWSDAFAGPGVGEEADSRVLDQLMVCGGSGK